MMDFSKLKYDVSNIPQSKTVISVYPDLADYAEFSDPKNDTLLRIAILSIDEGSPFLKKDRDDYDKRIRSIFEYLHLKDNALLSEIISGENKEYSAIVNRFFVLQDNLTYTMWQNMLFNFHMIGVALRQPPDMKNLTAEMDKRAKLQAQQFEIHEKLITYEAQIFPDATTRKIIRKEVAKIIQFPEKMAMEKSVS